MNPCIRKAEKQEYRAFQPSLLHVLVFEPFTSTLFNWRFSIFFPKNPFGPWALMFLRVTFYKAFPADRSIGKWHSPPPYPDLCFPDGYFLQQE